MFFIYSYKKLFTFLQEGDIIKLQGNPKQTNESSIGGEAAEAANECP